MIVVSAPSRLHFGLFNLDDATTWPNCEGQLSLPARRFGGVGLMMREPGLRLCLRPAVTWQASGPAGDRALQFARTCAELVGAPLQPQQVTVEACPPEHVGLGTGTQLALAVAAGLQHVTGSVGDLPALARQLGRGARSALGIHGFLRGGFLVEGGQRAGVSGVAPLLLRADFPAAWRLVLAMPASLRGLHGPEERQAFARLLLQPTALARTEALCRVVLLGLLPALAEQDLQAFGEALYDFNRRVGELFAPVQGGPYAHPRLLQLVEYLRHQGHTGVGQSSWGPTIFALVADEAAAQHLAGQLRQRFDLTAAEVVCTAACNRGAQVEEPI